MRPHRLRLQAFGSFPGLVDLDFDAVGAGGLFLLCGPTGAGKTTLLDALGFALYGVVPGSRRALGRELRSDHAEDSVETWVCLEFSLGDRRFRVTRKPEQQRASRRGRGKVVTDNASAILQDWDGAQWQPLATRVDAVGHELAALLGMNADQFYQVVVLPQGKFDAFLHAPQVDREKLLKQLFHVHRFDDATAWLAERARCSAGAADDARHDLDVLTGKLAQAVSGDGTDPAAVPEHPEEAADWAGALLAGVEEQAAVVREQATAASARLAEARRGHEQALRLAERQCRRREALAERDQLLAVGDSVGALRGEIAAARRAAPVAVAVAERGARGSDLDQAREHAAGLLRALAEPVEVAGPDPGLVTRLSEQADAARRAIGELSALGPLLTTLEQAATDAAQLGEQAERQRRREQELRAQVAAVPALLQAAQRRVGLSEAAAGELPSVEAALAAAQQRRELDQARGELTDLERRAEVAAEELRLLRQRRFEAMTAELAEQLLDATPCPVCGATEHPDPALFGRDSVTREQEEEANRRAQQALDAAATSRGRIAALSLADEATTGGTDPTELAATIRRLSALAADGSAARAALQALLTAEAADAAAAEAAGQAANQCAAQAERATERVQGLRAELTARIGTDELTETELASQVARLEERARALTIAAGALLRWDACHREYERAERALARSAAACGFRDVVAAQAAGRTADWLARNEAAVAAHDTALATLERELAGAELGVALEPVAPVEQTAAALAAAGVTAEAAAAADTLAQDRLSQVSALEPTYRDAVRRLRPLLADAAADRQLAELTAGRGANRLGMNLSSYVLAARLEEVAAAASRRLGRMSGGRYALVHTDTSRDRRSRAGLSLAVEDGWTGHRRDTASLSGGESFMASLSLALGLADVVTAETGGRPIEALFVDEGFGSLDAETLDQVMDVLDDLRSGGRLVGVVSHVPTLLERIPSQVRVRKTPRGSCVELTGVASAG